MKDNRKKTHLNTEAIEKLLSKKGLLKATGAKPISLRPVKSLNRSKSVKRLAVVPK